jgi:uncharacterized membrane protein YccC
LEEASLPSFPSVRFIQPGKGILPNMVRWKDHVRMKLWAWDEENLPSITHAIRTAAAATVSVIIARLVQMPEAYWAAIATLVIMQRSGGESADE